MAVVKVELVILNLKSLVLVKERQEKWMFQREYCPRITEVTLLLILLQSVRVISQMVCTHFSIEESFLKMLILHLLLKGETLLWNMFKQEWKLFKLEDQGSYQQLFPFPWAEESISYSKLELLSSKSKKTRMLILMVVLSWLNKRSLKIWLKLLKTWPSNNNQLSFRTD
jgi:hypothetical protein